VRVLACLALVACGGSAADPVAHRARKAAWDVRPAGGTLAIDPGAAPPELLDAQGCKPCHAAIVDEWAASRHALAWTNDIFQSEYSARPQPWCVNCHAPLTTQQRDLAGPQAAQGVDCATCHVRDGTLVSAGKAPSSPHSTVVDATFGTPAFCADCHQFTFPVLDPQGVAVAMTEHPMQTTVASFEAGPYAGERDGCLTCHGSKHGHAFAGAHDDGMLTAAVTLAACAIGDRIRVRVTNAAAGHAVPTGDIHRHMYLRIWRSSAPESLVQAFFGRRFEPAPDGGKRTIWDSTLAPNAVKTIDVTSTELGGDADEPISLELTYVFIVNEFPRGAHAPDAPVTKSIASERATLAELPACEVAPVPSAR